MSERRKIDINKFKKSAREQATSNKGGSRTIALPEGVEFFSLGKASDGPDTLKKDINIVLYEQTKSPKNESGYDYKRTYYTHNNLGPEGKTSVVCPTTFGKKCPICELYKEVTADWDGMSDTQRNQAKALRKKERTIYNVIDEKKIKIWDMSHFLFQSKLIEEIGNNDDEAVEGFASDDNGFTIQARFSKEKVGQGTFYDVSRIDFKERPPVPTELLNATVKLDDCLVIKSYEELQELISGETIETEEEVDEVVTAKPSTRRQVEEVEVADEEEDEDLPFDTEEEKTEEEEEVRKPRRKIVEEDEDDPWG